MCDFMSWIETKDKVYFLTGNQVFHTKKGRDLQAYCESRDDYVGHGAIRKYYGLGKDEGTNKECTDFSTPSNFPEEIAQAIKEGKMRGLNQQPKGLLSVSINKAYEKQIESINKAYDEQRAPIDKAYEEQIEPINKAYWEQIATIDKAYWEQIEPITKAYDEQIDNLFWNLFSVPENRSPLWR